MVVHTCNPSYLGDCSGRRIAWTQEAEVAVSWDRATALQPRQQQQQQNTVVENDGLTQKRIWSWNKEKISLPFLFCSTFISVCFMGVGTYLGLQPPLHQALLGPLSKMFIILQKGLHGIPSMTTISPNSQLKNYSTRTLLSWGKVSNLSFLVLLNCRFSMLRNNQEWERILTLEVYASENTGLDLSLRLDFKVCIQIGFHFYHGPEVFIFRKSWSIVGGSKECEA